jgi:3-isopropylmalate dehydrogenase
MLIEQLGERDAANTIVGSIEANLLEGAVKTYDLGGSSGTSDVGDDIAGRVMQAR